MKRLIAAVSAVIALMALVITGCTNKDLIGPAPDADGEVSSSCVTCHTDKDILKELAVTEEEATSEATEGEG